jgi:hypothetical protein
MAETSFAPSDLLTDTSSTDAIYRNVFGDDIFRPALAVLRFYSSGSKAKLIV